MAVRIAAGHALPRDSGSRRQALGLLALLLVLLVAQPALAQTSTLEQRVKSAFIFNFTKFVDWPPESFTSADAPLDICLYAADPIAAIVEETVRGKSAGTHPLKVLRVQPGGDLRACEMLYIGEIEQGRAREHLSALRGQAILTVSDAPDFLKAGGMIRFLIVDGKVRFEVNQGAAGQARLAVSSKLLSVAHAVVNERGG